MPVSTAVTTVRSVPNATAALAILPGMKDRNWRTDGRTAKTAVNATSAAVVLRTGSGRARNATKAGSRKLIIARRAETVLAAAGVNASPSSTAANLAASASLENWAPITLLVVAAPNPPYWRCIPEMIALRPASAFNRWFSANFSVSPTLYFFPVCRVSSSARYCEAGTPASPSCLLISSALRRCFTLIWPNARPIWFSFSAVPPRADAESATARTVPRSSFPRKPNAESIVVRFCNSANSKGCCSESFIRSVKTTLAASALPNICVNAMRARWKSDVIFRMPAPTPLEARPINAAFARSNCRFICST